MKDVEEYFPEVLFVSKSFANADLISFEIGHSRE